MDVKYNEKATEMFVAEQRIKKLNASFLRLREAVSDYRREYEAGGQSLRSITYRVNENGDAKLRITQRRMKK